MNSKKKIMFAMVAFILASFSGQNCFSNSKMYLLIPQKITNFDKTGFYNDGREWNSSQQLGSFIKDGILFLSSDGSNRDLMLFTAPGEYNNEKKINIKGQKYFVLEFDTPIKNHIVLNVNIMMEVKKELPILEHTIDCFNKSLIKVSLNPDGKTIHHLAIIVKGEKGTIGIKSIYLE